MTILILGSLISGAKEVWHYVVSSVDRGIDVITSREIITPISDVLDDDEFRDTYALASDALDAWGQIANIPESYTVSDSFAIESDFDWRQNHIMKMKIHGVDINTGETIEQWITVESEKPLSRGEWLNLGQEAVTDSPFGYSYEIEYVSEYEYFTKF